MASRDDHLLALGRVVAAASMMDQELMLAYAALRGTEDAAVDAAGKLTGWLVEQCVKLTRKHATITAEHKERILAALKACRPVSMERNRLAMTRGRSRPGTSTAWRVTRRPPIRSARAWCAPADPRCHLPAHSFPPPWPPTCQAMAAVPPTQPNDQ
jgi:hypothetical protein